MTTTAPEPTVDTETPFSARIREATMSAHRDAERSGFVHRLMRGQLPLDGVIDLAAQHHAIYAALETTGAGLADDPVVGGFLGDELLRVPALDADLTGLLGEGWSERTQVLPGTQEYVDAIRATADQPVRFVAHHYTRLMGDLSGGQMIRNSLVRHYGDAIEPHLSFYDFAIDDLDAYKNAYRANLDDAPWGSEQHDAFIDEVNTAYRCNSALFGTLDRAHPADD